MFAIIIVCILICAAIYLFVRDLIAPAREVLQQLPGRIRGATGTQTIASLQRQAAEEVMRRAPVSISARHLPNDILVRLHPDDYATVEPLREEFCEGVEAILDAAVRNGPSDSGLPFKRIGTMRIATRGDVDVFRGTTSIRASILERTEHLAAASPSPKLTLDLGDHEVLITSPVLVGRSVNADVRLSQAGVSREHAELLPKDGLLLVRDLGGRNGTLLNGRPVQQDTARPGDRIGFGPKARVLVGRSGSDRDPTPKLPSDRLDETTHPISS